MAQHYLVKAGISAIRRLKKSDNNRIARAVGAKIVNRLEDAKEADIGKQCGLFKVEKLGDEWFSYFIRCTNPKACTILLRGPSKDILNEVERNLHDAMCVARNIFFAPLLAPGGGATEMAISVRLCELAKSIEGIEQVPYRALAMAMEVIPRTLVQNCGGDVLRTVTSLRSQHLSTGQSDWGIDGCSGKVVRMSQLGVWEPTIVKSQTLKTAIEAACMLLRVDDICSGISPKSSNEPSMGASEECGDE